MADLDSLMNRKITIFTHDDTEYQGVLFNINPKEHSLVLRNVRVKKGGKDQNPDSAPIAFVSFPGHEIKDLYVDDDNAPSANSPQATEQAPAAVNAPATTTAKAVPEAPSPATSASEGSSKAAAPVTNDNKNAGSRQGTQKKPAAAAAATKNDSNTVFDIAHYSESSQQFNKVEAYAEVKKNPVEVNKYNFEDFFDNLGVSADSGRPRHSMGAEKRLNMDTFGTSAVNSYAGGSRAFRGGRGGGRNSNNNSNNMGNQNRGRGYHNKPYQSQFGNTSSHRGQGNNYTTSPKHGVSVDASKAKV